MYITTYICIYIYYIGIYIGIYIPFICKREREGGGCSSKVAKWIKGRVCLRVAPHPPPSDEAPGVEDGVVQLID